MNLTPKLYMKRKEVPYESLLDMKDQKTEYKDCGVYRESDSKDKKRNQEIDKLTRSSKYKEDMFPWHYPEVCDALLNFIPLWDKELNKDDYIVKEFNYLFYKKGDFFKLHSDRILTPGKPERVFSTSTIVSKTDLVGGELQICSKDGSKFNIDLEEGETVFFDSNTKHEVKEVLSGEREVLVAWIYKK